MNKDLFINDKPKERVYGKTKEKVSGYANTGAMPYDDDSKKASSSSEDSDLKILSEMEVHQVYNSKYPKKH